VQQTAIPLTQCQTPAANVNAKHEKKTLTHTDAHKETKKPKRSATTTINATKTIRVPAATTTTIQIVRLCVCSSAG